MEFRRPIKQKKTPEEGCKIEVKKTKSGKKIVIGRNCTKDQLKMLKESGETDFRGDDGSS